MKKILCVGVAVQDTVFGFEKMPRSAEKYRADSLIITGGGGAANAAVAVQRLRGHAILAARLGDDSTAQSITNELLAEAVDCQFLRRFSGRRSSLSAIFVDAAGERLIANYRDVELPGDASWLPEVESYGINAVVADTRWAEGAVVAMQRARDAGVPGVLDAEQPLTNCEAAIAAASHVVFSMQGLQSVANGEPVGDVLLRIARENNNWIAVTDGAAGVQWACADNQGRVAAFDVAVVDTLGAGDTWHGAFALALAEGSDETTAILFANAAAALKCTQFGGRLGIPDRQTVTDFLKQSHRYNP